MAQRMRDWWKNESRENLANNAVVLVFSGLSMGFLLVVSAALMLRKARAVS